MAKKKVKKKKLSDNYELTQKLIKVEKPDVILKIKEDEWRMAIDSVIVFEKKVVDLNQRIDRIVVAHTKCKSLKGL